jgi:hypothetical protein
MARGVIVALLIGAAAADALAARLKTDATLHARPSASSEAVGQVPAGTRVEVLSESAGWHEVSSPVGRGFVRNDQLVLGESGDKAAPAPKPAEKKPDEKKPEDKPKADEKKAEEKKPEEKKPEEKKAEEKKPAEKPAAVETIRVPAEEWQRLTDEVRLLRERPEPATVADLQRVEQTLTQAIAAVGEKAAAPPAPVVPADPPLPDTSLESVLAISPVLLILGGIIGWIAGRITQRRRDNRNRIRV